MSADASMKDIKLSTEWVSDADVKLPLDAAGVITNFIFEPKKDENVSNLLYMYNKFLLKRAELSVAEREAVLNAPNSKLLPGKVNATYKCIADREESIVDAIIKNGIVIPNIYPKILERVAGICKRKAKEAEELRKFYAESKIAIDI
jgi:hypothetical protein